jgi:hypothetical protein
MKKTLTAIACGLALALSATTAQALTILTVGDTYYLGEVDPGTGSPATEADKLNTLLTVDIGTTDTIDGVFYDRSSNVLCGTLNNTCPEATAVGHIGDDSPPIQFANIDVTDWTYLKGKYGNVMHVWYVADINDVVNIPETTGPGGGLSHWILYNPTTTVPDGGATLGLLGLGMLGLGMLRRRLG